VEPKGLLAALLLALATLPALAQPQQVLVTVDASPREGGAVSIVSATTSGLVPALPYTFAVPSGTQLSLSAAPNPGYKLWFWYVNGTKHAGDAITLTAQGSSLQVIAVYGPNTTLVAAETAVATVYVTKEGYVYVQPKPIQLEFPQLDQRIYAKLTASVQWVNETYTDVFGATRARPTARSSYTLVLGNICGSTCEDATFYAFYPNGSPAFARTVRNEEVQVSWPNRTAVVYVRVAGRLSGPHALAALEPAAPVPEGALPFLPLLPFGVFVALAVRSSVRDAALGAAAYALLGGYVLAAFGTSLAIPVTAFGLAVAALLAFVDVFGRR
jgi:hypothetical protein